jgi:hypothetical protein
MNEQALSSNGATKEEEYDISLVLIENLGLVWDECEKILIRSCKRSNGRVNTKDIYYNFLKNNNSIWIVFNKSDLKIIGCLVTEIMNYPSGIKMLNIDHIAGKYMERWIDRGLEVLTSWSKDNQCVGIEGVGRKGFWNWIKNKEGWKQTSSFYEIKFNEE